MQNNIQQQGGDWFKFLFCPDQEYIEQKAKENKNPYTTILIVLCSLYLLWHFFSAMRLSFIFAASTTTALAITALGPSLFLIWKKHRCGYIVFLLTAAMLLHDITLDILMMILNGKADFLFFTFPFLITPFLCMDISAIRILNCQKQGQKVKIGKLLLHLAIAAIIFIAGVALMGLSAVFFEPPLDVL